MKKSKDRDPMPFLVIDHFIILFFGLMLVMSIFLGIYFKIVDKNYEYVESTNMVTKIEPSEDYDMYVVNDETKKVIDRTFVLANHVEEFYDKCGVQPYIFIVDNANNIYPDKQAKQSYSDQYYKDHIIREDAILLTYYYSDTSTSEDVYCSVGDVAKQVCNEETVNTILDNIDLNWDKDDLSRTFELGLEWSFYKGTDLLDEDGGFIHDGGYYVQKPNTVQKWLYYLSDYPALKTILLTAVMSLIIIIGVNIYFKKNRKDIQ